MSTGTAKGPNLSHIPVLNSVHIEGSALAPAPPTYEGRAKDCRIPIGSTSRHCAVVKQLEKQKLLDRIAHLLYLTHFLTIYNYTKFKKQCWCGTHSMIIIDITPFYATIS